MKTYLGGSVYAREEGVYIVLSTENSNKIFLDQSAIKSFADFLEELETTKLLDEIGADTYNMDLTRWLNEQREMAK